MHFILLTSKFLLHVFENYLKFAKLAVILILQTALQSSSKDCITNQFVASNFENTHAFIDPVVGKNDNYSSRHVWHIFVKIWL